MQLGDASLWSIVTRCFEIYSKCKRVNYRGQISQMQYHVFLAIEVEKQTQIIRVQKRHIMCGEI